MDPYMFFANISYQRDVLMLENAKMVKEIEELKKQLEISKCDNDRLSKDYNHIRKRKRELEDDINTTYIDYHEFIPMITRRQSYNLTYKKDITQYRLIKEGLFHDIDIADILAYDTIIIKDEVQFKFSLKEILRIIIDTINRDDRYICNIIARNKFYQTLKAALNGTTFVYKISDIIISIINNTQNYGTYKYASNYYATICKAANISKFIINSNTTLLITYNNDTGLDADTIFKQNAPLMHNILTFIFNIIMNYTKIIIE
jgi:hypothetical protein